MGDWHLFLELHKQRRLRRKQCDGAISPRRRPTGFSDHQDPNQTRRDGIGGIGLVQGGVRFEAKGCGTRAGLERRDISVHHGMLQIASDDAMTCRHGFLVGGWRRAMKGAMLLGSLLDAVKLSLLDAR